MRALVFVALLSAACGSFEPLHPRPLISHNHATAQSVNPPPPSEQGGPVSPGDCFAPATFDFPNDALACDGPQFTKHDDKIGLTVGVVLCNGSREQLRLYLSDDGTTFFPAADDAGNGQDECEVVNPQFTIANEDEITSGDCSNCSAGVNLPLEGVTVWARAAFGQPFEKIEHTPVWSYQTSVLGCGFDVAACSEDLGGPVPTPPPAQTSGVPCDANETVTMAFDIPLSDMNTGASTTETGVCTADVTFFSDLNDIEAGALVTYTGPDDTTIVQTPVQVNGYSAGHCSDAHCGTLTYGDGHSVDHYCDVYAFCDPSTHQAQSVTFTW